MYGENCCWKDIPGYNGKYQVNFYGEIRRVYEKSGKTKILNSFPKKRRKGSDRYVVHLSIDGKTREEAVIKLVSETFIGKCPDGFIPIHKNGLQSDNCIWNIEYITLKENGKRNGSKANRRPVAKISSCGDVVCFYSSAREAARENFMSYQTVIDRCNGKVKSLFAPDGYVYVWDEEKEIKKVIRRIVGDDKRG